MRPNGRPSARGARLLALPVLVFASIALAGCFGDGDEAPPAATASPPTETATATTTPTPEPTNTPRPSPTFPPVVDPAEVAFVPAYDTVLLDRPVEVFSYPLGGYEIAVADQGGIVYGVQEGVATPILDLSGQVLREGNEEGLLSVALDPQFSTNRHVWAYYSAGGPRRTVLARFTAAEDGSVDPATELVVLEQAQPFPNHNGGAIRFGPDRLLYLGLGDGGSAGDPDGNGQDLGTLLGTVVRLDVSGATEAEPYAVPDDNPFVSVEGDRAEIYAYGLRNPWRMAFDPATGDLWVADVGQNASEEVDRIEAGGNYGWNILEGHECYAEDDCTPPDDYVAPLAVYDHGGGRCSVTGGVVARRVAATSVEGAYLYGDFCSGELWALRSDTAGDAEPVLVAGDLGSISSISQVGNQIYILRFGEPMLRLVDEPAQ